MKKSREPKASKRRGNGEGGVHFRADRNCWEGTVSMGFDADGKRLKKKVHRETKEEVLDEIARMRLGGVRPELSASERPRRVADVVTRWLQSNMASWQAKTQESRVNSVNNHINSRLNATLLKGFNSAHVERFYAALVADRIGPAAIDMAIRCFASALKYAVRVGILSSNPADGVPRPKYVIKEMHCLCPAQARRFLEASAPFRYHVACCLALGGGLRRGEVLGLRWPDVNLDAGKVTVRRSAVFHGGQVGYKEPKTKAAFRTVTLPTFAIAALRAYRAQEAKRHNLQAQVVCTSNGNPLMPGCLSRMVKAVIRIANNNVMGEEIIPPIFRFHDLRHSCASLALAAGCSIRAVSARLGHSSPAFTLSVYCHAMPSDDQTISDRVGEYIFPTVPPLSPKVPVADESGPAQ